jgi:hypothetical protein
MILRALDRLLENRADQGAWHDYTCFASRDEAK